MLEGKVVGKVVSRMGSSERVEQTAKLSVPCVEAEGKHYSGRGYGTEGE